MQGLVLALFGACVGSFTNVVAWRLPRQESVVVPGSHCPRCGHAVRWHDNLPIFGWLLLLGRCRDCRSPISVRYPVVEALSAGLWLSAAYVQPSGGGGLPLAVLPWAGLPLIALLLPLVLIDFDHMWLPEPLCRWGVLVGLSISTTAGLARVRRPPDRHGASPSGLGVAECPC
jgi:leader peptidase (prepilin peptidase)/N-methyltransferase